MPPEGAVVSVPALVIELVPCRGSPLIQPAPIPSLKHRQVEVRFAF